MIISQLSISIYFLLGIVVIVLYAVTYLGYWYECLNNKGNLIDEKAVYIVSLMLCIYFLVFFLMVYISKGILPYESIFSITPLIFSFVFLKVSKLTKNKIEKLIEEKRRK